MNPVVNLSLSRRGFLGLGMAAGGALVLGFSLPERAAAAIRVGREHGANLNAFISIGHDGIATFFNPFVEMGQGVYTSVPMALAEELDIDMSMLRVADAPADPAYRLTFNNTYRITGGSASVRSSYDTLRHAGATGRAMLVAAAAKSWQVPESELHTEPGFVVHAASSRRAGYGELAPVAARLPAPEKVTLKDPSDFRLLGKLTVRTDVPGKTNGQAIFGMDIHADNMLFAAIRQAPIWHAQPDPFDHAPTLKMPGVAAVEILPTAVAVLADNSWRARKAVDSLPVTFSGGTAPEFSSEAYLKKLQGRLNEAGHPAENKGDVAGAFSSAAKTIEADYHAPYLAHATMEPQTCTALVENGRCTVWAPNQGLDFVVDLVAKITNLPADAIDARTPLLGGGFGRRIVLDYVEQAVTLANRHPGRPVKVVWSREDDMQHDYYRPLVAARYRAAFDAKGVPTAVHVTTAGDGPNRQLFPSFNANPDMDNSVMEGCYDQPYSVPAWRADFVNEFSAAPVGYWRSVGNSFNAFFKESFIDEMAAAAGKDPVDFRRTLLAGNARYLKVLDTAASMASWRTGKWRAADGRDHAMGIALHESFGSIVAEVAEVSLDENTLPVVHQVWCAVDCGFAVNPLVLVHQVESAVAYGLSATLHEQITIQDGRTTNANFDTYPVLTAQEMPEVAVQIINGGGALGGIGEVGTPPIAPAVCNALHALTGKRIRSLPLSGISFS